MKAKVRKRDLGRDRILRILSVKEVLILQKNASRAQLQKLDAAHVFAVSTHPEMCYEVNNVVLLNRFCHESLDNMKDPITGRPISQEENLAWWERILGPTQWEALMHVKSRKALEEEMSNKLESKNAITA